mgnify:FL=1
MGMSEREFLLTTPRYFYYRQKGFEILQTEAWQRTRMAAFYAFLPHTKKNAVRRPQDLFGLPGDAVEVNYAEEERAAMIETLRRAREVDFFAGQALPKAEA